MYNVDSCHNAVVEDRGGMKDIDGGGVTALGLGATAATFVAFSVSLSVFGSIFFRQQYM